jgi:hypothetical protein
VNSRAKIFWFRHYWWAAPAVAFAAVGLILWKLPRYGPALVPSMAAGCFGLVYVVQKQKLDEISLFERLFSQFNERYARMNDCLEDLHAGRVTDPPEVRRILNAYFNLCAEEFERGCSASSNDCLKRTQLCKAFFNEPLSHLREERVRKIQATFRRHGLTFRPTSWPKPKTRIKIQRDTTDWLDERGDARAELIRLRHHPLLPPRPHRPRPRRPCPRAACMRGASLRAFAGQLHRDAPCPGPGGDVPRGVAVLRRRTPR